MSTCARCGRQCAAVWPGTSGVNPSVCYTDVSRGTGEYDWASLACRDAELANLRSLLRSQSVRLEKALELLDDHCEPCSVRPQLESILEMLS